MIEHHPIVGVGIGGQPRASRRLAAQRPAHAELRLAHDAAHGVRRAGGRGAGAVRVAARGRRRVLIWRVTRRDQALGLALGARLLGAVRARALLQRLPRGSAHVARDRPGGGVQRRAAGGGATAGGRRRVTQREGLILSAVLLTLVAITLPELGSDPWHFRPPSVDPQGLLAPLVRAAGEEWDLGIARACGLPRRAPVRRLRDGAARALAAGAARLDRRGSGARRRDPAGRSVHAPPARPPRLDRPVVLHERLHLPGRAGRRPACSTATTRTGTTTATPASSASTRATAACRSGCGRRRWRCATSPTSPAPC